MKTVVAFSGGIDSTYNLWKCMTTTDDDIIAAYFDDAYQVINYGVGYAMNSTSIYQLQAARMLVDLLRAKYPDRPFEFVVNNIYEYADDEVKEIVIVRHYASKINSGDIDKLILGASWRSWEDRLAAGHPPELMSVPLVITSVDREFNNICTRGKIEFPYSENKIGTASAIQELPKDILDRTVSCVSPIVDSSSGVISNCGSCHKCREIVFFNQQLALGKTAAETMIARDRQTNQKNTGVFTAREKFANVGGIWAHVTAADVPASYGAAL